jgi:hypothetical protein
MERRRWGDLKIGKYINEDGEKAKGKGGKRSWREEEGDKRDHFIKPR